MAADGRHFSCASDNMMIADVISYARMPAHKALASGRPVRYNNNMTCQKKRPLLMVIHHCHHRGSL